MQVVYDYNVALKLRYGNVEGIDRRPFNLLLRPRWILSKRIWSSWNSANMVMWTSADYPSSIGHGCLEIDVPNPKKSTYIGYYQKHAAK